MTTLSVLSASAAGDAGDGDSTGANLDGQSVGGLPNSRPVFTADSTSVLFTSLADNLVTPDALGANGNLTNDLYLKTVSSGAVVRVDTTLAGVQPNASVQSGSISGDGTSVVFDTRATNLDLRGADGSFHVYDKSLVTGALTLISPSDYVLHNAATGTLETLASNLVLQLPAVSADGRYVAALAAPSTPLTATAGQTFTNGVRSFVFLKSELVVFDTLTHTAVDLTGVAPAVVSSQIFSTAGSTLVFSTNAHLVAADATRDDNSTGVYTYNTATGALALASTNAAGVSANQSSDQASISADGTKVAFSSVATNLSPADTDTMADVYGRTSSRARSPSSTRPRQESRRPSAAAYRSATSIRRSRRTERPSLSPATAMASIRAPPSAQGATGPMST